MPEPCFLAIDVGTGSVRAGLFTANGRKLSHGSHPIKTRNKRPNFYEQSSSDIWRATKASVHAACQCLKEDANKRFLVSAIGIDATCSLVVCADDQTFSPISVTVDSDSDPDNDVFNILLWLDRRATEETAFINKSENEHVKKVRSHFGNVVSPENEPPKLLWLKRNNPDSIEGGVFFDLADWLAFKLHGNPHVRSVCTVACKWGWGSKMDSNGRRVWSSQFWDALDLSVLTANDFYKIGSNIIETGRPAGCLTQHSADELGLTTDCLVASPIIDADAGSLWTLGIDDVQVNSLAPDFSQRVSLIMGTSTCMLALSPKPLFVHGVWGPFPDAILPGYYVTTGGQSVTGKLLEYTVESHPAFQTLCDRVGPENVYDELARMTEKVLLDTGKDPAAHIHCLDYHAGNRSPLADPSLQGCMIGLALSTDEYDLAVKFRATVQALCYGAKHILDEISKAGCDVRVVTACGGLCQSKMLLTELADCLSLPIFLSSEEDTVLLGGSILGQVAYSLHLRPGHVKSRVLQFAREMMKVGNVIHPNEARQEYHIRKYKVYTEMYKDYVKYRHIMESQAAE